jgi:hypothetical protein
MYPVPPVTSTLTGPAGIDALGRRRQRKSARSDRHAPNAREASALRSRDGQHNVQAKMGAQQGVALQAVVRNQVTPCVCHASGDLSNFELDVVHMNTASARATARS